MTAREGLSVGLESGAVSVMRANVLTGLRRPHPGPLLEEREIAGRGGEAMKDEIVIRTIVLSC